jgi:membrane associated rhomboid family serine protease
MPPLPPVTQALMLICTAVFCLQWLLPPIFDNLLSLWPLTSGRFMPWQILSYGFLHGDFTHLFFNMFGLWMFGAELERLWGPRRYLQVLLASLLAAALCHLLLAFMLGRPAPVVGASGMLFGLLLANGMLFANRVVMLMIPPVPLKMRTMVLAFGILELAMGLWGPTGIAHFAHLGGMLGAWLMISWWRGKLPFSRGGRRR